MRIGYARVSTDDQNLSLQAEKSYCWLVANNSGSVAVNSGSNTNLVAVNPG